MAVNLVERKTETHKVTITFEVDLHGTEIDIREARNALDYISDEDNMDDDQIITDCLGDIIARHIDNSPNQVYKTVSIIDIAHEILKSA